MVLDYKKLAGLVIQAQNGDMDAFSHIYNMTQPVIYGVALKTLENHDEALDAVQDAYTKMLNSISSLTQPDYFLPWAKRLTYNLCINRLANRRDLLTVDVNTFIDRNSEPVPSPESLLVTTERQDALVRVIDSLPPKYRDAFKMKNCEDMSVKEIAQVMECPEGTVKSRLSTARKLIIEKLRSETTFHSFGLFLYPASAFIPVAIKAGNTASLASSAGLIGATGTAVSSSGAGSSASLTGQSAAKAGISSLSSVGPLTCGLVASVAITGVVVTDTIAVVDTKEVEVYEEFYTTEAVSEDIYGDVETLVEFQVERPRVLEYEYVDGGFVITMDDPDAIILYDKVYAVDEAGNSFSPTSFDANSNQIVVSVSEGDFTLYTPDIYGNNWNVLFEVAY